MLETLIYMNLVTEIALKTKQHQDALLHYIELKRTHVDSGLALSPARLAVLHAEDELRTLRQDIICFDRV